jgi:predicted PurR-regulated permease PerM
MRADGVRWTVRGAGLALGAGGVALVALVASRSLGVILLVFIGILLAASLEPLVARLRRHFPLSRGQAVIVAYAAFFLAVAVLGLLVVPAAIAEAERVAARIPDVLAGAVAWTETVRPQALGDTLGQLLAAVQDQLAGATRPPAADDVVEAGFTIAEALITVTTLLVVVAFWLVERARLQRYVLAFLPHARRAGGRAAWNRVERRLGLWTRGQLVLMATVGIASGVAYQLLGLPSALLLGLIAGVCEVIPLVGPLLGAIPALLVALTISPETALAVAVVYVIIQFVEGNFLVPIVMRNAVGLSPLLVLLSLLAGAATAGIVGALLAVPVAAAIEILVEPFQAREVPVASEPRVDPDGDAEPEPEAVPAQAT